MGFEKVMDGDAFDGVVGAHHAEIHRFVARVTARPGEADDLSQETFLRAYRAWGTLPPDANVRAWLFAIAANLCRNHFRSEKRRRLAHAAAGELPGERPVPCPESQSLAKEDLALVEATIARLPVKQRMAFVLRKIHGLEYDEVAGSLACSPESARAHVFQALRKIRQSLNGHPFSPMERER